MYSQNHWIVMWSLIADIIQKKSTDREFGELTLIEGKR